MVSGDPPLTTHSLMSPKVRSQSDQVQTPKGRAARSLMDQARKRIGRYVNRKKTMVCI